METTHLPDEGLLQAYLDGELAEADRASVAAHVHACSECARSLEELRAAAGYLSAVVQAHTLTEAVDREAPHPAFLRRRLPAARALARAAGLVVLLAGSAAVLEATTGWIGDAVRAVRGATEAPAEPVPLVPAPPQPSGEALFTVQPRGGTLEVLLEDLAPGTLITVRLDSGDVGEVRIGEGATGVTYRAGPGSATVVAPDASAVEIGLPADLTSGRVVVNGETAVVKAAERLFSVREDAVAFQGGFRFRLAP
jgi:hypothetical protein